MDNIHIIGTSHIAKQSELDIKNGFLSFQPDFIAIELDKDRLQSLLSPQKKSSPSLRLVRQVGLVGFFFVMIGGFAQKKLGKLVGVTPGADMLYAVHLAKNNELSLALVDRPIHQTLRRLSKAFTFREKMRFVGDICKAPFQLLFAKLFKFKSKKITKKGNFNLNTIPEKDVIIYLMDMLKQRYPSLYSVLIEERNHYMVKRLVLLAKKNPDKKILAVVGAGHKEGMLNLLSVYEESYERKHQQ